MKRAVLCVQNPHNYIDQLDNYSIMIVNPNAPKSRIDYLLNQSDYSLLISENGHQTREGNDYPDEKVVWYTSGTVGDSKFYSFSQFQLDQLCKSICQDLDITNNDRYTGVMGLWHAHGQSLYWATRWAGCQTHFLSIKELRDLPKYQPTFVSAIPDILKTTLHMQLPHLRFLRSGSAPLSTQLNSELKEKFNIPVVEYFGITEAMSHVLSNPLHGQQHAGTVGIPTTGVEAKIENENLWLRSPMAYTDQWFDTGDLAQQDQYGFYKILGRNIDRINIKGYKIDPASIEQQLKKALPQIESVVIFGQQVCNCVYVGDVSVDTVTKTLKEIYPLCAPECIQSLSEIPTPGNGKISRTWLRQKFGCR